MDPIHEAAPLESKKERPTQVYSRTVTEPRYSPVDKDLIQETMGEHLAGLRGRAPKSASPEAALQSSLSLATTRSTTPIVGFPQFSKLPSELRDIIWRFAMYPRIVSLPNGSDHGPGVLRACAESRYITRQMVERIYVRTTFPGTDRPTPLGTSYHGSMVFFRGPDDVVRVEDRLTRLYIKDLMHSVAEIGRIAWRENPVTWWAGAYRLVLPIAARYEQLSRFHPSHIIGQCWSDLAGRAKEVEEVIFVFDCHMTGYEMEDFVEIKESKGEEAKVIDIITDGFKMHERTRKWKLTFMEKKNKVV
jgi:hypothetical protein